MKATRELGKAPAPAARRLYLTNESGTTVVLATEPNFKILSENELDGSMTLSSPVVSDHQSFIRTSKSLYCLAKK